MQHSQDAHSSSQSPQRPPVAFMEAASDLESSAAIRACRSAYQRVLAGWASDVLRLQRRGLHRLRWRGTHSTDHGMNQAA